VWSGALNGGARTASDAQRSGGFKAFFLFLLNFEFSLKTKRLNCQLSTASKLFPRQAGWTDCITANSREGQTYGLFPDKAEE